MFKTIIGKYKIGKLVKKLQQNKERVKLHVGCGKNYFKGWINIDNNSDHNIDNLDFNWDLRNNIPLEPETVDFIYNEHFLEHLTVGEGLKVLKDFRRILKKGAVLRIAMSDLLITVKRYFDPNWRKEPVIKKFGLEFIKTKAERINIAFHAWGHKWLYDDEELLRRLKEAGFTRIRRCKLYMSSHKNLRNLETREESTLIMEAIK